MGAGLVGPHADAPPELSLVGQSQVGARVSHRGVGVVVILLQLLLQQAVVRKLLLEKHISEHQVVTQAVQQ